MSKLHLSAKCKECNSGQADVHSIASWIYQKSVCGNSNVNLASGHRLPLLLKKNSLKKLSYLLQAKSKAKSTDQEQISQANSPGSS